MQQSFAVVVILVPVFLLAAFSAQVRRGFVIMEINRHPVRSVADYNRFVSAAKPGDVLAMLYYDPTLGQRALLTVTVE